MVESVGPSDSAGTWADLGAVNPLPSHLTLPGEAIDHSAYVRIAEKVRWLSTALVHFANSRRKNDFDLKIGGHQASSASMVEIMVSLWFSELQASDYVSVKPHASPVLHA